MKFYYNFDSSSQCYISFLFGTVLSAEVFHGKPFQPSLILDDKSWNGLPRINTLAYSPVKIGDKEKKFYNYNYESHGYKTYCTVL